VIFIATRAAVCGTLLSVPVVSVWVVKRSARRSASWLVLLIKCSYSIQETVDAVTAKRVRNFIFEHFYVTMWMTYHQRVINCSSYIGRDTFTKNRLLQQLVIDMRSAICTHLYMHFRLLNLMFTFPQCIYLNV